MGHEKETNQMNNELPSMHVYEVIHFNAVSKGIV